MGGGGRALLEERLVCPMGLASASCVQNPSSLLHEAGHTQLCDPPDPQLLSVPLGQRRPGEVRGREGHTVLAQLVPGLCCSPGPPGPTHGAISHHAMRDSLGHRNSRLESLLVKRIRENTCSYSARNVFSFLAFFKKPSTPSC